MKLLLCQLLFLVANTSLAQVHKHYYPLIQFEEVATTKYDSFRVAGIVTDIYVCPPCPKNAKCKPCIGDHLTIANLKGSNEFLLLFTEQTSQFKKEQKFIFLLTQRNKVHPEFGTTLIEFEANPK